MAEDVSILSEIDEALRAEKLQQLWARYSGLIIAFCVLAVLGSAASVLWKNHLREAHERQTGLLAQGVTLAGEGKYGEAIGWYEKAEVEGGQVAALAALRHAEALIGMKQEDKARALYEAVAAGTGSDAPAPLRDFARLEAAILTHNRAATAAAGGAYGSSLAELNALRALDRGDAKTAATLLGSVLGDEAAPLSQRTRAAELLGPLKDDKK